MSDDLHVAIFVISILAIIVLISRQLEKRWPIDGNLPRSEVVADWKATGANFALSTLTGPITAACSTAIVQAFGGGYIPLRTDGWRFVVSLVGFIIVGDLYRYIMHRLEHAVPFLWSMHSFHHSAEALTYVTGARHFWAAKIIEGGFFPLLAILFEAPAELVATVGLIYFLPDSCAHLNVRVRLGRAITWFNNPQWHRIHHSTRPEHLNKNFASLLPLWDILFGTAWIPRPDEYPPTGLVPGEKCGVMVSIFWPFRRYLPQLERHVPARARVGNWQGMRKIFTRLSGSQNT
jgi:sterol desaturase/sphingolipid hydroxylase (fatty acid hydroxylase superfamily)